MKSRIFEMKLSPLLRQFWSALIGYVAIALITVILCGINLGWIAACLTFSLFSIVLTVALLTCQPLLVTGLPQAWRGRPLNQADYQYLDLSLLDSYSEALRALGFQPLQDYTQGTGPVRSMARCFGHPEQSCFAEVGWHGGNVQQITHTVFFSILDRGWMLVDFNHAPSRRDSLAYTWRNQREVRRYHPDLLIDGVFHQHLSKRQAMVEDLKVNILPSVSWEIYCEIQQELVRRPTQTLRQKNLLVAMIQATRFEQQPSREWLGAYSSRQ
jgi:hypothetical protein